MTDRITAAEFQRRVRQKAGFIDRKSKMGNVPVHDPETGKMVDSKAERGVLWAIRQEAKREGRIVAIQPMFQIEGGTYRGDAVEIEILPVESFKCEQDGTYLARVRFVDVKGHDPSASKKSRRQVRERYGVEVQVIHTGRKARKGRP